MKRFFAGLISTLILLTAAPHNATAQDTSAQAAPERYAEVRLIAERATIRSGETLLIGIEKNLADGWHTYWLNAGDSGEPAKIKWHLPEGFHAGEQFWPVPVKITLGPLTSFGYEGQPVILQEIAAPYDLPEGPLTLTADIELLVCDDICIPEYGTYSLTLNDGRADSEQDAALIDAATNRLPMKISWPAFYSEESDNGQRLFSTRLEIEHAAVLAGRAPGSAFDILTYEWGIIDNHASAVTVKEERSKLILHKPRGDRPLAQLGPVKMLVAYNDREGHPAALEIIAAPEPEWLAGLSARGTAATSEQTGGDVLGRAFAGGLPGSANGPASLLTLATALLFALLGGIILNLMPCVFPILSMKALSLCKMSGQDDKEARMGGLFYTAGILACFAVIAGVLIALKAGGAQLGWGFHLQNPVIVLLLAYLLFVIGLSLSGLFEIKGGFTGAGSKLAGRGGATGAFFTGVLATLVATPCTAPFMGLALGFALVQPAPIAMAIFLMLGFGLALPYLLLAYIPALRGALPKPGPWMNTFKEFLAFPMYASAAWLVWVYSQQTTGLAVLYALAGLVSIGFAIWLFRITAKADSGRFALRALAILILLSALSFGLLERRDAGTVPAGSTMEAEIETGAAQSFSASRFAALEAGDEPLFINMTAAWCITCKLNERVALNVPATRALFAEQNISYLIGDWTNEDPEITAYLARYGRNGVPLYVYYGPRDTQSGERPEAVVLPPLLTPTIVKNALSREG